MLDDFQASEIASAWHSVMSWSDPGVAMYSVTSTGRVHSEEHRGNLLAYIDAHMDAARACDASGDDPIVGESNEDDLCLLREWVETYEIG